MTKKDLMIIAADYSHQEWLSLTEFCEVCGISPDDAANMIAYDIIRPERSAQFSMQAVQRTKKALRLQQDLEINLASVALIFDLLEEMDAMHQKLALFEKHYKISR